MKSVILHQILSAVAEICEINENEIVSHVKQQDVVDARTIFVYSCLKYGFPAATVAKYIHRSRICSVRDYYDRYGEMRKQSNAFKYLSNEVVKKLAETMPSDDR